MPSLPASAIHRLFDDAGLFPPAQLPMAEALVAHERAVTGRYRRMVGPFLCPISRLDEMNACVAAGRPRPSEIGIIAYDLATAGGRRLEPMDGLVQCEAPLGVPLRDLGLRVPRYLEIPHHGDVDKALAAVAAAEARVKVRCGGPTRQAVPSCRWLAEVLIGSVERSLTLKATAGLHQPFRHIGPNGPQHGFINLLAAAAAARTGGTPARVADILAMAEPKALDLVDQLTDARQLVSSIGSCSIDEPVEALVKRGLLT